MMDRAIGDEILEMVDIEMSDDGPGDERLDIMDLLQMMDI